MALRSIDRIDNILHQIDNVTEQDIVFEKYTNSTQMLKIAREPSKN